MKRNGAAEQPGDAGQRRPLEILHSTLLAGATSSVLPTVLGNLAPEPAVVRMLNQRTHMRGRWMNRMFLDGNDFFDEGPGPGEDRLVRDHRQQDDACVFTQETQRVRVDEVPYGLAARHHEDNQRARLRWRLTRVHRCHTRMMESARSRSAGSSIWSDCTNDIR